MSVETISDILSNITVGAKTVFDLKNPNNISITRQNLPPVVIERDLARSPKRSHTFFSMKTLLAYLGKYGSVHTVVLGNHHTFSADIIMDETSEFGFEVLRFQSALHPLCQPWANLFNKPQNVTEFAKFIMKHRRSVESFDDVMEDAGKQLALVMQQITVSKSVEIAIGTGRKTLNGVMVTTEINGMKQDVPVEIPEEIVLSVPVFIDSSESSLVIDLMIESKGDDVFVTCSCADFEKQQLQAFEDCIAQLGTLEFQLVYGLGDSSYTDWKIVE